MAVPLDPFIAFVQGRCPTCGAAMAVEGQRPETATGGRTERLCANGHTLQGHYHTFA